MRGMHVAVLLFEILGHVLLTWSSLVGQRFCEKAKQTDEFRPKFTQENLPTLVFGCFQQFTAIHCCMSGYRSIRWMQLTNDTGGEWERLELLSSFLELREENQTLAFTVTSSKQNGALYRCIGEGTGDEMVSHTIHFKVKVCNKPAGPPDVDPYTNNTVHTTLLGAAVRLSCRGYFGHTPGGELSSNFIIWRKRKTNTSARISENTTQRVFYETTTPDGIQTVLLSTLYIRDVTPDDLGEYTCLLINPHGSRKLVAKLQLHPECNGTTENNVAMYSERERIAMVGASVNFACHAYVCSARVNASHGSVGWMRLYIRGNHTNETISEERSNRVYYKSTRRDNGRSLMATLFIRNITESDYGHYRCQLMYTHLEKYVDSLLRQPVIPAPSASVAWKVWTILLATVVCTAIFVTCAVFHCRHRIQLYIKKRRAHADSTDNKEYDVFVLFNVDSDADRAFVYSVLCCKLEKQLRYRLNVRGRDDQFGDPKVNNLQHALRQSRSVLVVVSPDFLEDEWNEYALQAQNVLRHCKVTYIVFRDVPERTWASTSKQLQFTVRLGKNVRWPSKKENDRGVNTFWRKILLRLPSDPSPPQDDLFTGLDINGRVSERDKIRRLASDSVENPLIKSSADDLQEGTLKMQNIDIYEMKHNSHNV